MVSFRSRGGPAARLLPIALLLALVAGAGASAEPAVPSTAAAEGTGAPDAAIAPRRDDGMRSEFERAWFRGGADVSRRAKEARGRALQLGARNVEAAARALVGGPTQPEHELERARLAVDLAPDLPSARMALAAASLRAGEYGAAVTEAFSGLAAIPRNLEASVWLAASLLSMFAAVLICASILFIVGVAISVFRHAAHDLGDMVSSEMPDFARTALLGAFLLVPLVLGEGVLGFVLGLFALGVAYSESGGRRALALAGALVVLGLFPVTRLAGMALFALDADPVAAAAHAVTRSMESPAELERLERAASEDWLARAALALHARRVGDPDAFERHQRLLAESPNDASVLVVLGNMHFEQGRIDDAIVNYERAAGLVHSATLMFNLSQAYARSFRMEEFEQAMQQAQAIDMSAVAVLSQAEDPSLVADLPFDIAPIRARMLQTSADGEFVAPILAALAPGRLGRGWMTLAAGFALVALVAVFLAGRWDHSSNCTRCGRRICGRCGGTFWNQQLCDGCHHLFHRPETTDPSMRTARLAALRRREARLSQMVTAISLVIPGAGGLLARRADLSFLGLFFFVWAVVLLLWHDGVAPDPFAVGAAGPLAFAITGCVALLGYVVVAIAALAARRSW